MKQVHGGDIVARMLKAEGVEKVFGIIDGTYFGLYANLREHGIELISPRHETCAAHMAGTYSRATGKLGVCIASNGPGVANVLPGVAVENGEGNRVLLITSCRREGIAYPDRGGTYQYFNQTAVTKPMTKWSGVALSRDRVPELMRRALREVFLGRPGVVHLDIPESIINGKDKFDLDEIREPHTYRPVQPLQPNAEQVEEAAKMLRAAKQPLIHAGSGIIHARAFEELQTVADLLGAPVTTSWGARGVLPETHASAIPMINLKLNNRVRNDADVVLGLGSRFGETDWWGKPPYWRPPAEQRVIQVDLDPQNLGVNKPVSVAIQADVRAFLARLAEALQASGAGDVTSRKRALDRYAQAGQEERAGFDKKLKKGEGVNPGLVVRTSQQIMPDTTMWVFDGGNTAVWANFFHQARVPNTIFSTFKFGMLGAGVSQAIGAKAAAPDRPVCCLIGDGAMGFHIQEIETAVRHNLDIIYVVFTDRQWGMVKLNQQFSLRPWKTVLRKSLDEEETINADFHDMEFHRVGEAMGAYGERVSKAEDLQPALERARDAGRTAVLHVDVDRVEHMWAPGLMAFKDMHLEPGEN